MTKFATILSATAALVAIPATALAQPGLEPRAVEVRYSDLNLASEAGRASLDRRINQAVRSVCGVSGGVVPLNERAAQQKCAAKSRSQAIAAIKTPTIGTLAAK